MSVLVLMLAVSAACCLGFGFVLQQNVAQQAPLSDFLSPRLLLDLMRVPRWLGGIGLMVAGMVLGAIALGKGEVSLVEPLLATNLLFALALSRKQTRQPLGRQGWAGLALLAGGVTTFIVAGEPRSGTAVTDPFRHWLIIGVMVGLALLLTTYAKRSRLSSGPVLLALAAAPPLRRPGRAHPRQRPALHRGRLHRTPHGLAAVRRARPGVTGLVLVQSAFETAPCACPCLPSPRPSHSPGSSAASASWATACAPTPAPWPGRRWAWPESS